ncbi:MAG: hypothetical protein KME07_18515 [Pegethrix bostrychoides GSE-TBD4-15B]|jgi:hypothetical protein|uniref:Uncharacterized protein n=1 Tax=Pegethrix bostrychoides GSE-TBD4-15B TaxID=2839662 RepID=A0A951PFG1_9CYAN|nr:hypothetical protein [Pegethrix bostrychoides GSE-TBD4-15B]
MPLIEPIRDLLPLPVLSYFCPLLIIGSLLISFGHWLYAKGYIAIAVYSLSIFTHSLMRATVASAEQAAIIGGFLAPAVYGLGFVCFGAVRALRLPYGRTAPVRIQRRGRLQQLMASAIGGGVGIVTGASLGAVAGLALFLVAPLLALNANLGWQVEQSLPRVLAWNIELFGIVGFVLGLLSGWGLFNFKHLGDRILIYVTIQGFVAASAGRRLLKRILRR